MCSPILWCASLCLLTANRPADAAPIASRQQEAALASEIVSAWCEAGLPDSPETQSAKEAYDVSRYAGLVRKGSWTEAWPDEHQREKTITVNAEVWTDAIQTAINENAEVHLPDRPEPYYIDRPLILRSGRRLRVAPKAEIRLKPGSNCCMVRNEHLINGQGGAVTLTKDADHDIAVSGGIWTTLATSTSQMNGNVQGYADPKGSLPSNGVVVFSNVRRVQVANLTVRQSRPHGVQLSNCTLFRVEGIRFQNHRRDGVHINGPASYGIIRDIRNALGVMGDDMIALNAWDWKNTVTTFGPIHHILVEGVEGDASAASQAGTAPNAGESRSEIRLLAGTKHFDDGKTLDCNIESCILRSISGIHTFKMYDQPNLELGRDKDFADPIGTMKNLFFSDLRFDRPTGAALFQIHSNVHGVAIRDVALGFEPTAKAGKPFTLVQVGPISMTIKFNPNDPASWVEVFSPDKDCVVEGLRLSDIRAPGGSVNPDGLIRVISQTVNKDYPRTTPRGGTGKGILR